MPDSNIEAYIDELENLINNSKTPLAGGGSKKIIDADATYEIIDDIKRALPGELQQARRVLLERKEILDAAEEEARRIVSNAEEKAETLASDQEIVRRAKNYADRVEREAREDDRDIRYWAKNYVERMLGEVEAELSDLITNLTALLQQTTENRKKLEEQAEDEMPPEAGPDDERQED